MNTPRQINVPSPEHPLGSRSFVEPERKQATVLFADIKDSMQLAARDPEVAMQLLVPVQELMIGAVEQYGGTVIDVMGDGIMAIFGAPRGYEDHAMRACSAALAMQDTIREYARITPVDKVPAIKARVGVSSGEVVVGEIRGSSRADYSAVGLPAHLAARLEQLAPPDGILVGPETFRLVEHLVQVRSLGPTPIKGLPHPVELFELLGVWPSRTRWRARAMRGLTPLMGRAVETKLMRDSLEKTENEHGQFVALVGDPGVGKSRMAWECSKIGRDRGWLVLETAAVPHVRTVFRPMADLLRNYFEVDDRADTLARTAAIMERLRRLDPALEAHSPALLDLMGLPFDSVEWRNIEPAQRKARTMEALQELLRLESRRRPVLVVVEDLHWIDTPSQELIEGVAQILPSASILLLVTYRRDYLNAWKGTKLPSEISIEPLPEFLAEAMLDALLGTEPRLGSIKQALIAKAEGNPFFLEECVNGLIASKVIVGGDGAYRPERDLADFQLPTSVHALLAARIDRLDFQEKRLLQTIAVAGRHVPVWLIRAITELPELELQQYLGKLQSASFLFENAAFADREYAFVHALIQEVAYRSLVTGRRRFVHRKIVEAMEVHYGERGSEFAELLGHHAFRGEHWGLAVQYLRVSGLRAMNRSEYSIALDYLKEALAAASHLQSDQSRLTLQVDIRFDLRNVLWAVGRLVDGIDVLDQAEPFAVSLNDPRRLARLAAHRTSNYFVLGENEHASQFAEAASSQSRGVNDPALVIDIRLFRGVLHNSLGEFDIALENLDSIIALLDQSQRSSSFSNFYEVHAHAWRVWCLAELGRFAEASAAAEHAARVAKDSRNSHHRVTAYWAAGYLDRLRGRTAAALISFERANVLCQTLGIHLWLRPSTAMLGEALVKVDRVEEGTELLLKATQPSENNIAAALWEVALADAYLRARQSGRAYELSCRTTDAAMRRKELGFAAYSLRVQGSAAAAMGRSDEGEKLIRDALVLASERRMLPLMVLCHCALEGIISKGHEHMAIACKLCDEMGIDVRAISGSGLHGLD